MFSPSREYAAELIDEAAERRMKVSPDGFDEVSWRAHSFGVARLAEKIAARTSFMDPYRAYVSGLLHDIGKRWNEYGENTFHPLSGYHYMSAFGFKEVARTCLTHSFLVRGSRKNLMPNPDNLVAEAARLVRPLRYDDYDRLIQLCDWLNDCGTDCTIEFRARSLIRRYSELPERRTMVLADAAQRLKARFDRVCGGDIYEICAVTA